MPETLEQMVVGGEENREQWRTGIEINLIISHRWEHFYGAELLHAKNH